MWHKYVHTCAIGILFVFLYKYEHNIGRTMSLQALNFFFMIARTWLCGGDTRCHIVPVFTFVN